MSSSFTNLVTASTKNNNLFLVSGGKDKFDREAWYYVKVEPYKESIFQREISKGKINLQDYGKIIESGFGKKPPAKIQEKMKEEYNFTTE